MYTGWGDNPPELSLSFSLTWAPLPPTHAGPPAEAQRGCQVILNTSHSLSTELLSPLPPAPPLIPSPTRSLNLHYNEDGGGEGGGVEEPGERRNVMGAQRE